MVGFDTPVKGNEATENSEHEIVEEMRAPSPEPTEYTSVSEFEQHEEEEIEEKSGRNLQTGEVDGPGHTVDQRVAPQTLLPPIQPYAETGYPPNAGNVKKPSGGQRSRHAQQESSRDGLDGGTRSKGVAAFESMAHAVFQDEYEDILQREIAKISGKIRDRLHERQEREVNEEEEALRQLKFEKVYGMPSIRVKPIPV